MPNNMPRGGIDVARILGTVEGIKSQRLRNKITDMGLKAAEKKAAKEEMRNLMAREYIDMGQPESQVAPQYEMGDEMPQDNLAAYQYGQPPEQEAVPPTFDKRGYGEALLRSGDIEGFEGVQAEGQAEQKAELDRVSKVYAMNPQAGVRMWNDGLLGEKHGKVEHLGVKDGMQININQKTGEVIGVNKKSGDVKVLREGKAAGADTGDIGKELGNRTKIANLVNKDLQAKYGRAGVRYDIVEGWIFPPGFDQDKFGQEYNRLEKIYQKEYGIKPIEKEPNWPAFKGKKGGARPPLDSFYE